MSNSKCKHYGMSHYGFPSNGNQCPIKDGFAPCEMEVWWKKEPNWSKCLLNPDVQDAHQNPEIIVPEPERIRNE